MNYRTLGPAPGRPLICSHFYSSHQFAEATLTNSELMAEHLRFKTFPMDTRCLHGKNIPPALMCSTDRLEMKSRGASGEVCGEGSAGNTMWTHIAPQLLCKYPEVTGDRASFCSSAHGAKINSGHASHFLYCTSYLSHLPTCGALQASPPRIPSSCVCTETSNRNRGAGSGTKTLKAPKYSRAGLLHIFALVEK